MLVPQEFIYNAAKNGETITARFYLCCRFLGANNGGYFDIKDIEGFTPRQIKQYLKRAQKLGWIVGNKITSIYKIGLTYPVGAHISKESLKNNATFRGWILAATESYVLNKKVRQSKDNAEFYSCKHLQSGITKDGFNPAWTLEKFNAESIRGEVSNGLLSYLLGVSKRTITRWRKDSINKYHQIKEFAKSKYAFKDGACFFDEKRKLFVKWHLIIDSAIFINYFNKKTFCNSGVNSLNSSPGYSSTYN